MKFHPPNRKFSQLYRRFLYRWAGKWVLLLTTRGRRSGRLHTVGLQYELINGCYHVGAAGGDKADWYRNLQVNSHCQIQVGKQVLETDAEIVTDSARIADFLEYRLKKHPLMIRSILRMDGIREKPEHGVLVEYAGKIRLVILRPVSSNCQSADEKG